MKGHHFHRAILIALLASSALLFSCVANDADKKTLLVHGTVHVYRSDTPPADYPGSDFIAVIGPKDNVKVMQVMQKRNYKAVKIRLNDGREGWVFSGESIELKDEASKVQ